MSPFFHCNSWAKWIRKIYETDPRTCSECGEPMRIIAVITDPREVVKILSRSTIERGKGICVLSGPFCRFSEPSKAMEIPSKKERHRKPNTVKSNPSTFRYIHWSRGNIPLTHFDFPILLIPRRREDFYYIHLIGYTVDSEFMTCFF